MIRHGYKGLMKKIPGLVPGIFFLFSAASWAGSSLDLATALFDDGQWAACRRECTRVLVENPDDETARLMKAISALRENFGVEDALASMKELAGSAADPEIRALAGYESGRHFWRGGAFLSAWEMYKIAFDNTRSPRLYLESGYALDRLSREDDRLIVGDAALLNQLKTMKPFWTADIRSAAKPDAQGGGGPGAWVVAFYRHQIRPAIGQRCSLYPSCSEYYLQANHAHGWLSVPMLADRLVREPGVVSRGEQPVEVGTHTRYADPLGDHTFWLRDEEKSR